ncbi:hypothetical protein GQR58_027685 [Nymphon striatum]|nr:hypothetical protein GQR58_027685 [Nymphon striatum]
MHKLRYGVIYTNRKIRMSAFIKSKQLFNPSTGYRIMTFKDVRHIHRHYCILSIPPLSSSSGLLLLVEVGSLTVLDLAISHAWKSRPKTSMNMQGTEKIGEIMLRPSSSSGSRMADMMMMMIHVLFFYVIKSKICCDVTPYPSRIIYWALNLRTIALAFFSFQDTFLIRLYTHISKALMFLFKCH